MNCLICQTCGKAISPNEKAVSVSYGYIAKSGRFYCRQGLDYFHKNCNKAFRTKEVEE